MRAFAFAFALAIVGLVVAGPAAAQPACPEPVSSTALRATPGAQLEACSLSAKRGDPAKPDSADEFTLRLGGGDGARIEYVVTRGEAEKRQPPQILRTTKIRPHSDRIESQGAGMALLFWAFAAATIGGALFVITRRNLIAAVMGMVGSFLGISAIYMMLYAHFLSVVQMLVYAGAIMVLFVFVIMVLNRPEDEPVAPSGRAGQAIGALAIVYLVFRLIMILIDVRPPTPNAGAAPAAVRIDDALSADWGSVKAVGMNLFGDGLFPFEAISILLLVAVVGAIAIAKPLHGDTGGDDEEGAA